MPFQKMVINLFEIYKVYVSPKCTVVYKRFRNFILFKVTLDINILTQLIILKINIDILYVT